MAALESVGEFAGELIGVTVAGLLTTARGGEGSVFGEGS